jgi:hypothetical protein
VNRASSDSYGPEETPEAGPVRSLDLEIGASPPDRRVLGLAVCLSQRREELVPGELQELRLGVPAHLRQRDVREGLAADAHRRVGEESHAGRVPQVPGVGGNVVERAGRDCSHSSRS